MRPQFLREPADGKLLPPAGMMLARKLSHHVPLDANERSALDAVLGRSVRHLGHHTMLAEAGSSPNEIQILIDGWACRYTMLGNGRRRIVAFYLPGDICDFDVFLMARIDQPIVAIGNARVAGINRQTLNDLSRSQPRISQSLWWESMVSAAIQRAWTVNVGRKLATQRIAHLFCELHTRLSLVGLVDGGISPIPLTQADLGDACAITSIHANRALQALRGDGLIDFESSRLKIHDWNALRDLAEFTPDYLQVEALCSALKTPAIPVRASG